MKILMIGLVCYLVISMQMLRLMVPRHCDSKISITSQSSKSGSLALDSFTCVLILSGLCCMFTRDQFFNLAVFLTVLLSWTRLDLVPNIPIITHYLRA